MEAGRANGAFSSHSKLETFILGDWPGGKGNCVDFVVSEKPLSVFKFLFTTPVSFSLCVCLLSLPLPCCLLICLTSACLFPNSAQRQQTFREVNTEVISGKQYHTAQGRPSLSPPPWPFSPGWTRTWVLFWCVMMKWKQRKEMGSKWGLTSSHQEFSRQNSNLIYHIMRQSSL